MKNSTTQSKHTDKDPAIKECVCEHAFQDHRYGKGMRVMNPCYIQNEPGWRCTVCRREHN